LRKQQKAGGWRCCRSIAERKRAWNQRIMPDKSRNVASFVRLPVRPGWEETKSCSLGPRILACPAVGQSASHERRTILRKAGATRTAAWSVHGSPRDCPGPTNRPPCAGCTNPASTSTLRMFNRSCQLRQRQLMTPFDSLKGNSPVWCEAGRNPAVWRVMGELNAKSRAQLPCEEKLSPA
jgi:hypothetical protein